MGLLAAAQEHKTRIRGASFVDRDGNELFRDTESTPTGGPVNSPDIELLRDDLVELLYGATQPSVEYLFDDSISTLQDDGDSVRVTFERAAAREFDLVIGADGLHSNVRRLVFGPEEQFVKRLELTRRFLPCPTSWSWTTGRPGITVTPPWLAFTVRATTPKPALH